MIDKSRVIRDYDFEFAHYSEVLDMQLDEDEEMCEIRDKIQENLGDNFNPFLV